MAFESAAGGDVDISIPRLFASIWRARYRLAIAALLAAALAFAIASVMKPKYRAETRILIESRESVFTRPDSTPGADAPILSPEGVKSQVEVMSSTDLLKKVAAKLDLASHSEFDPAAHLSQVSRLLILLGLESDPSEMPKEERVVDAMRQRLDVYNVDNSRVIVIQFSSTDRKLAAAVPNAIADEYIALQEAANRESNSEATGWLGPEIASLEKNVKTAEAKVAQYRADKGLLMGQNNSVLSTQRLSEIASELSRVQADRAASEAKAAAVRDALKSGTDLDTLPDVVASPLIQRLREEKVQIKSQIADLSTTLLDGHPRIRALKSQLSDLDVQIRQEARKVLESLQNAADIARRREADLTQELDQLKAKSALAGQEQVELNALERDATAQRQLLESYMTRYREAASREDHHYLPADARVFSQALVPGDPYFPKKVPITATALVGTLLIGSLIVLLRELFSGRALVVPVATRQVVSEMPMRADRDESAAKAQEAVETEQTATPASADAIEPAFADELDERMKAPDGGLVPAVSRPSDESGASFASSVDEPAAGPMQAGSVERVPPIAPDALPQPALPDLADAASLEPSDADLADFTVSAVARHLIDGEVGRAFVISPEGDEGSAAAVLLVRELADRGLRSILVDLTGTGIAGRLMLEGEAQPGITDLLASEKQFTDVIHMDRYSDAHVIPAGQSDPVKAMSAADRLPIIINALQSAYDIIVVECGPADVEGLGHLAVAGAQVVVSVVDPEEARVAETAAMLADAGHNDVIFMTSRSTGVPVLSPRRKAAMRTTAGG